MKVHLYDGCRNLLFCGVVSLIFGIISIIVGIVASNGDLFYVSPVLFIGTGFLIIAILIMRPHEYIDKKIELGDIDE